MYQPSSTEERGNLKAPTSVRRARLRARPVLGAAVFTLGCIALVAWAGALPPVPDAAARTAGSAAQQHAGTVAVWLAVAVGCLLLGVGLLFVRAESGIVRLVTSDTEGGRLARRLLPISLAVPFVLGLLLLSLAPWVAIIDLYLGAAVLVTLTMTAFAVLVHVAGQTLDHNDTQRRAAESEAAMERSRGDDARALAAAEREQHITELRRALEIRDEFLAIAAHELRTPLSALALQLEGLRRGFVKAGPETEPGRALRKIQTAVRQTERLNGLVQSLLDVSRIGAGRLALDLEEVDVTALVHEVARRMEDEAARHGSTIHVQAAPGVKAGWDRQRVEEVLVILLANAVKYGAGKPVHVELSADGDEIAVTVVDRGIGVRAEDQSRIFEIFERAVPAQHYGGLGLGLYIAKEIAVAHGGDIGVESRPGEGATFTLRLPRRAPGQSGG